LAPVLARLGERGATVREASEVFLVEGQSRSLPVTLDAAGCVGFLAVGAARVRDVDLFLHTDSGTLLVEDSGPDAHPYVRFCGAQGLGLELTVRMHGGQGVARVVRFDEAPASIGDLEALLGECVAPVGGVRRPQPDLGPAPDGRTVDAALAAAIAREVEAGRAPDGAAIRANLPEHERFERAVPLAGDACYAITAVGGPTMYDLDVAVAAPNGAPLAQDASRDRDAQVAFCTDAAGSYRVSARAYEGHGELAVQLFRVREPAPPRPAGLVGGARVRFAELSARMSLRGFSLRPLAWGQLGPGERLAMPLAVTRGECVAVGGVASDELDGADLDLVIQGDDDRLVAWHVGANDLPLVYVCAERDERLRIIGRVNGPRLGRYLVVVGESHP
jgi:hypothetical protein